MATEKKDSEGIALLSLSIYGDEDDEMEDVNDEDQEQQDDFVTDGKDVNITEDDSKNSSDRIVHSDSANDNTSPLSNEVSTPKSLNFGTSTPQNDQLSLSSPQPLPPQQQVPSDSNRIRKGTLTIVDYGHDEVALSPEAEEGEIVTTGRVMFGMELQTANVSGDFQEKMSSGTVQVLTPSTQATPPQSSEQFNPSQSDPMNYAVNESEAAEVDKAVNISIEVPKDVDPLDRFLPSPPKAKCSDELQEKIKKFLAYKRSGKSFNSEVRNRKEYRNPDFLQHAVMYQDIDQIGSCFSKDVFDPRGYDKSDYYDEIEADMKREMERKEQEKKKSQKVEFIGGGTQPGTVASAPKINMPITGVSSVVAGGLHSVPAAVDTVARDGRQNKKSKWDKVSIDAVDGDRRNPLPTGGQESVSAVGSHAAILSAANAGTGYTAFALQRRREAEERRSSEKKLDRRS